MIIKEIKFEDKVILDTVIKVMKIRFIKDGVEEWFITDGVEELTIDDLKYILDKINE